MNLWCDKEDEKLEFRMICTPFFRLKSSITDFKIMKKLFWIFTIMIASLHADSGYFAVSEKYELFYETHGNPEGIPVIVLHGGPGLGCRDEYARFFDLNRFFVLTFDQRGAMRSKPFACMEENTTQLLVEDIEKLRNHLKIKRWIVFGGSWGSLLGLVYGETHPEACLGFILRGIFLGREQDINLFSRTEAEFEPFQDFLSHIPIEERDDLLAATYKRIMDPDPEVQIKMALAFFRYFALCVISPNDSNKVKDLIKDERQVLSMAKAMLYYSKHQLFLEPNQVLSNLARINHLRGIIVHGSSDINCLPEQARLLHQNWENSRLWMIENAGHSALDPLISQALIEATKSLADEIDLEENKNSE